MDKYYEFAKKKMDELLGTPLPKIPDDEKRTLKYVYAMAHHDDVFRTFIALFTEIFAYFRTLDLLPQLLDTLEFLYKIAKKYDDKIEKDVHEHLERIMK